MPAIGRKINLLPPSDFELSFWGRFLKWAVTAGRYIIILTELVVICAFLSRFKLDNDISELNSAIEGKKNILDANASIEQEFRTIQAKTEAINTIYKKRPAEEATLEEITKSVPDEIKLDSLSITKSGANIRGKTTSQAALGKMLLVLNQSRRWSSVMLSQITADEAKGISFTLDMTN